MGKQSDLKDCWVSFGFMPECGQLSTTLFPIQSAQTVQKDTERSKVFGVSGMKTDTKLTLNWIMRRAEREKTAGAVNSVELQKVQQ